MDDNKRNISKTLSSCSSSSYINQRLDKFFEDMGYGNYQMKLFMMLALILFTDSIQMLLITLILKNLKKEMNITNDEKSFLISSVFIGIVFGSLLASKYIDVYGRKPFLIYGGIILLVFSTLSAFSQNATQLIIFRILLGTGIGIQMPAGINLASESIPKINRSLYLTSVWMAFPIGEFYCSIFAWFFMPNFEENQWRKLIIVCTLPIILSIILSFGILESPRYYYSNNKYENGKDVLIKIEEENLLEENNLDIVTRITVNLKQRISHLAGNNFREKKPNFRSTSEKMYFYRESTHSNNKENNHDDKHYNEHVNLYKEKLIKNDLENNNKDLYHENCMYKSELEANNQTKYNKLDKEDFNLIELESKNNLMNNYKSEWTVLFSDRFIGITFKTWTLWICGNIVLYQTVFILPQLLLLKHEQTKSVNNNDYYLGLLLAALIATPKALIAGILSEYYGRIKAMIYTTISTIIIVFFIMNDDYFIALLGGLIKVCGGIIIAIIKVYSTEIYPTKLRALGSSSGHSLGRLFTVFIPFISQYMINLFGFEKAPFLFLIFFCVISLYCLYTLPYDTKDRFLDSPEKEDIKNFKEILNSQNL